MAKKDKPLFEDLTEPTCGSWRVATNWEDLFIVCGPTPMAWPLCPYSGTRAYKARLVRFVENSIVRVHEGQDRPKTYQGFVSGIRKMLKEAIENIMTNATAEPKVESKAAKAKAETAVVAELKPCACGCGGTTKSNFIPGHDAKAHSLMKRVEAGEVPEKNVPATLKPLTMKCSKCGKLAYKHESGIGQWCREAGTRAEREKAKAAKKAQAANDAKGLAEPEAPKKNKTK